MKIRMIRHGKVDMQWPEKCSSQEYDAACAQYDICGIEEGANDTIQNPGKIYISSLIRTKCTADLLFPGQETTILPGLEEVPLHSYRNSNRQKPLWLWNMMARLQWYFSNPRQLEKRQETVERANRCIDELEKKGEDCTVISHGFFLITFQNCLKKRGYKITGNHKVKVRNLGLLIAEKE